MFEKFVPAEESALAKALVARLAARDVPAVLARLDASLQAPDMHEKLENVAKALPLTAPTRIRTVGSNTHSANGVVTYDLSFEYQYPDRWMLANVVLQRRSGELTMLGIHFLPRTQSLARENAFTLKGKSASHLFVLAAAVAIPLFVLVALVVCARTRLAKRKWLWLVFVALGVVQFQFNWTTGAWGIQPLAFLLLGAGYTQAGPVAPLVFTLAFPLGALVFLARRKALRVPVDGSSQTGTLPDR